MSVRRLPDRLDDLEVVVAVEARVDPALQADLGRALGLGLDHPAGDLVQPEQVRRAAQVERQRALGEGAEPALEGAHVGVVDVAVGDPGDGVADRRPLAARRPPRRPRPPPAPGPRTGSPARRSRAPGRAARRPAPRPRPSRPAVRPDRRRAAAPACGGAASAPEYHRSPGSRARPSASERSSTGNRMAGSSHRSGSQRERRVDGQPRGQRRARPPR